MTWSHCSDLFQHISFVQTGNINRWKIGWRACLQIIFCCVHNYLENFLCQHHDQLQSMYFSQMQASFHVTILHRHALLSVDGEESTEDDPAVVTTPACYLPGLQTQAPLCSRSPISCSRIPKEDQPPCLPRNHRWLLNTIPEQALFWGRQPLI